jgi:two-component system, cell cycle response regulator
MEFHTHKELVRASGRRTFAAVAGLGVLVHGILTATGSMSTLVDDWLYCGLYMLAAAACAARGRRGDARLAWSIAAVGVVVWGSAEIVFRVSEPDPRSWYPQSSQALLFIGFSLAYATLGLLARERVRHFDPILALDGLLTGLAAAALAALLLFPALGGTPAHHTEAPPQVFLVGALIGLMFVVTVIGMTGWRPGPAWALIATAIAINVCGDAVLVHLTADGSFHRGSLGDTCFVASALLLGLASFYPSRYAPVPHDAARRLPVPVLSAVAALGVLISAVAHGAGGLAAGLAAGAIAVMIARMTIALELLERSRRQALADDLTGLGNRRLLVRDLRRRLSPPAAGRPFTLALFDLDGFKRYNDTFGHPSGDALLVRLAGRLADAVGPHCAYRMGGDEFCAIVDGDGPTAAAALARASRALSEHGDAFSITSSTGAVECPIEASSASAALGVADGRMYVEKARRSIDQVQTRDAVLKMLHERDPNLRDHMREVAAIAMRVASRMGLDEPSVDQVARAAELHDIGKIAVPDAILHKADALDADEWRFMREYPIVGERILRSAPSLAPIAPLVRSSHERWDGLGYPDGLEHGQIPLGSRIIAVCDAYRSMRSVRPYKRASSESEALDELRRCAGTQFDPAVVRALCDEVSARASARERRRFVGSVRSRPPRGH